MSSNLETVKLGSICDVKGGKRLPKGHQLVEYKTNHPYIRVRDLSQNATPIDTNSLQYITEETFQTISRYIVNTGDIVLSNVGSIGLISEVEEELDSANLTENCVKLTNFSEDYLPRFIKYFLSSRYGQNEIAKQTVGAVQPKLAIMRIKDIDVVDFSIDAQKKIAHILSTLDDKIELNRKMNQTLEEMAQTLFKSWFVDFDPVHAKANSSSDEELEAAAKELGISKEILDLFPSEFEESELGMIPKGWEVKKFGDIVVPKKGKSITKKTIIEGDVPVVAGGLSPAYYHNQHNVESPVITISASGANAGYTKLYNTNIWASDCSYINNTNSNYIFTHYVYLKLKQSEITWMQQGAAQPHIYPSHIMRLDIVDAGNKLWDDFESTLTPMFEKIALNELEIQTLQKTRDTLLPKLLSGELDVSELDLDVE